MLCCVSLWWSEIGSGEEDRVVLILAVMVAVMVMEVSTMSVHLEYVNTANRSVAKQILLPLPSPPAKIRVLPVRINRGY